VIAVANKIVNSSDFLCGLSGTLWPLHLKPKPQELLSSWIIRFSHAHCYKSETICTILFGYRSPVWNRDVDKLAPEYVLNKMIEVTGATVEQAYNTVLLSYQNYLTINFNSQGNTRWILPLGIVHRSRSRPSLMYCPQCFAEDSIPYYRKLWRVAWVTVCSKHKIRLLDTCSSCGAIVMPHRADMRIKNSIPNENTLIHCFNCGISLAKGKNIKASSNLTRWQRKMERAAYLGYLKWQENPSLYSFLFFDGVRELSLVLMRQMKGAPSVKREIEFVDLDYRYKVMTDIAQILARWPVAFRAYVKKQKLSYSYLKNYDLDCLPYWYECEIKTMTKKYSNISDIEAQAIRDYVIKKTGIFSETYARTFSGRDLSGHLSNGEEQ